MAPRSASTSPTGSVSAGRSCTAAVDVEGSLLKALNDGGLPSGTADPEGRSRSRRASGPYRPRRASSRQPGSALRHDFQRGLTKLQWQASLDVAFTPFSGKLGLFSAIFTEYDIYMFGGVGLRQLGAGTTPQRGRHSTSTSSSGIVNSTDPNASATTARRPAGEPNSECLLAPRQGRQGVRVGGSFGAGLHLFITDWMSINPEIHDIVVGHNDAGLNATINDVPPVVEQRRRR